MAKDAYSNQDFADFLAEGVEVRNYDLDDQHNIEGMLSVKIPIERKPKWSDFAQEITGEIVDELGNKSSSAVLIIRHNGTVFAFTLGYGRYLIDATYFVQDFGIKTALNTLNHDSLRSVDLHTLDEQGVQKRLQTTRNSEVTVFGIDISKDILRSVTGSTKDGVIFKQVSGGDSVFSFGLDMNINELPEIADQLSTYYDNDDYKGSFSWVDNIRRIKEKSLIDSLDEELVQEIKNKSDSIVITLPEISQWDEIYGFSFTRSKKIINPTIESEDYLVNIDADIVSIESIKRDKLYVHDTCEKTQEHSLYKCLYFENKKVEKTCVLFLGIWYEIDNTFIGRVNQVLGQIKISELEFPTVYTWEEDEKFKIESEGDYNERAADDFEFHLLDKKLVKSNKITTAIEVCDLMTDDKHLVHVKHRKGGSSGLSHLFAQGNVSAEILLGDKEFRRKTRTVLRGINPEIGDYIPLKSLKSSDFEVVYLILGESSETIKDNLPFFSKVNLTKAFENLSQKGFAVSISGAAKEARPTT